MFETDRLRVRNWRADDLDALCAIYGNVRAMRHFDRAPTREEARARLDRWQALGKTGATFAPLERRDVPGLVGFCGLLPITREGLPNVGGFEIGWTLHPDHWGQGYATEAAEAWLARAFGSLGLQRVVAFTVPANRPSRAVMERIGMRRVAAGDFDHPNVAPGPFRRHVLYEITRS